ncbi:MAG: aliphatic sulfonate ABC transporter substrate-binding protein [Chloroflexi bacterium]|nr:aliphatic sulfonate ABC transporter substrate-binding protein [Chloroflexota bacterium]
MLGLSLGATVSLLTACAPSASPPSAPAKSETKPAATSAAAPAAQPAATKPAADAKPAAQAAPATSSGNTPAEIRLGFQPPYVAIWVMQRQKLLEEEFKANNVKVQFQKVLSPPPMYEALTGGSLDLGMGGPPIPAIAAGRPMRIVALTERSPKTHALLVKPDGPLRAVEDLKGKKIATPLGKAYAFPLRALERAGLKDTDVEIITVENNEGRSALLTGSIDGWATWDPFYASVEADKQARKLVDGDPFYPNYVTLFGRTEFIEKYPEAVVRFLKTYGRALAWVKANRDEALKIFTEENQYKPEVANLTWERRNYLLDAPNDEFMADVKDQAKMYVRLGVAQNEPDWDTAIDMKLARQALAG